MATLSNSSLSAWLRFDGSNLPAVYECQYVNDTGISTSFPSITPASCAQVCNDSASLFWPPISNPPSNNLVTCGLWTTLMSSYTYLEPDNNLQYLSVNDSDRLLAHFHAVGLHESDVQYLPSYADTIGDCFELIYVNAKEWSFYDDGRAASACHRNDLFPLGAAAFTNLSTISTTVDSLSDCLKAICTPLTLNPDLAGIGVFSSFIVQSVIAIAAFVALLGFELWSIVSGKPVKASKYNGDGEETHTERIATALVEFHKAQCYFSSVIQVTALSLFLKSKKASTSSTYSSPADTYRDFFDTSVLIVLATAGLIPVNLTISCIARYGRQSWYLLILTLITSAMATVTLSSSYYYSHHWGKNAADYSNNLGTLFDTTNAYGSPYGGSCALGENSNTQTMSIGHTVNPLCGNSDLTSNGMPDGIISNRWTWLVWVNCFIWLFFCLLKQCYDTTRKLPYREYWDRFFWRNWLIKSIIPKLHSHHVWIITAVIPWSLCFASQFWLFSEYFRHSVISNEWSFGQIIAIAVWIPCLMEYLYIEFNGIEKACNYKYPSPLKVVRMIRRPSLMHLWSSKDPNTASSAANNTFLQESRDAM